MSKYRIISLILLIAAIFTSGGAYCQEETKDHQIRTAMGEVTYVDPESGVINVKTDRMDMVFYILVESDLFRRTHHMASIEIQKGDSVIIQYDSSSGKNNIIKLVDNKPDDI